MIRPSSLIQQPPAGGTTRHNAPGLVSFLVANYNGGPMLKECLDSIRLQTYPDVEVIVVDNGSTDNSWDLDCFDGLRWRLLRLDHNSGFSPANNLAMATSRGEFVALINNDVILSPDWTTHMVHAITANAKVGSAACLLLQRHNPDRIDSAGFAYHSCGTVTAWRDHPRDSIDYTQHNPFGAVASAALYRRTALDKTGLFHDRYFAYYEDTDLAIRLILHGYPCAFTHAAIAFHLGSATGVSHSRFHTYHLRRNIEYLYWVDMVGTLALRYLVPHLLYESAAFVGAVRDGLLVPFLSAKAGFLRNLGWVMRERRKLHHSLSATNDVRSAKRRLCKHMSPWQEALATRWSERGKPTTPAPRPKEKHRAS
jgi:GT2 family glycosyltransferase